MIKGNVERQIYSHSKTTWKIKITPNQGFSLKDQNYLKKYDNTAAGPAIQMFKEEIKEENGIVYIATNRIYDPSLVISPKNWNECCYFCFLI